MRKHLLLSPWKSAADVFSENLYGLVRLRMGTMEASSLNELCKTRPTATRYLSFPRSALRHHLSTLSFRDQNHFLLKYQELAVNARCVSPDTILAYKVAL